MSSMSRFKVGDRVRVRKGLDAGRIYGGVILSETMKALEGREQVVINDLGDDYELSSNFIFSRDMLELAERQITITYTGNKGEAHKALEAEIKRLSGAKATPERVERAKALVGEILLGLIDGGYGNVDCYGYAIFYGDESDAGGERPNIDCVVRSWTDNIKAESIAVCSPEDEYNVWIGRAVALCKAVGKELPGWLIGKEG